MDHNWRLTSTLLSRRLIDLRQNVFYGKVPKPEDKRQGPPRDQCHSDTAISYAATGFVHVDSLSTESCQPAYKWRTDMLAMQACPCLTAACFTLQCAGDELCCLGGQRDFLSMTALHPAGCKLEGLTK